MQSLMALILFGALASLAMPQQPRVNITPREQLIFQLGLIQQQLNTLNAQKDQIIGQLAQMEQAAAPTTATLKTASAATTGTLKHTQGLPKK